VYVLTAPEPCSRKVPPSVLARSTTAPPFTSRTELWSGAVVRQVSRQPPEREETLHAEMGALGTAAEVPA
jgi:hypothetical protein